MSALIITQIITSFLSVSAVPNLSDASSITQKSIEQQALAETRKPGSSSDPLLLLRKTCREGAAAAPSKQQPENTKACRVTDEQRIALQAALHETLGHPVIVH